jgi:hypothetical protein
MTDHHHIRYLHRQDLDDTRWDECIRDSPNGLIYAKTFFLDKMTTRQWDALVLGDYQAVMPLTWRKKYGFTYLYQPFFAAALGAMGREPAPIDSFLAAIPPKFRLWDIHLNETNAIPPGNAGLPLKIIPRVNYLLSLDQPYPILREGYSRLAGRMLKKAAELSVTRTQPSEVIRLYQDTYRDIHPEISNEDFQRLNSCAALACANGQADAWLAQSSDKKILAFYLVFTDRRFVYSTLGGSTEMGKELGAFYLLTDTVIHEYAGQQKIFRFEGSDIPGIAFFNSQFGPQQVYYPHITLNRLPFPVNLFKRV